MYGRSNFFLSQLLFQFAERISESLERLEGSFFCIVLVLFVAAAI